MKGGPGQRPALQSALLTLVTSPVGSSKRPWGTCLKGIYLVTDQYACPLPHELQVGLWSPGNKYSKHAMNNNFTQTSEKLESTQTQTSIKKKMARESLPWWIITMENHPPSKDKAWQYMSAPMRLADIMLNGRSQVLKSVCMVPFPCGSEPEPLYGGRGRQMLTAGRRILMEEAVCYYFVWIQRPHAR